MKNSSYRSCLTVACSLAVSVSASSVNADWQVSKPPTNFTNEYNNGKYGSFPPEDIEQQLLGQPNTDDNPVDKKTSDENNSVPANSVQQGLDQSQTDSQQNLSQQFDRQPAYYNYDRGRYATSPGNRRYNRNTTFSGPWNNNGYRYNGPWRNNRSSFNTPWGNNNGSSFNMPWGNNNGSNFSPWGNNNGSSFNMPWGNNNGSNFSPWGNGGSWRW